MLRTVISLLLAIPPLAGVELEASFDVAGTLRVRPLPGHRAIEVDVPLPVELAHTLEADLPAPLRVTVEPLIGGTRMRISHPDRALAFAHHRGKKSHAFQVGPVSEDARLRALADRARRPLPPPAKLGARLELWQEAEAATAAADLPLAQRLWTKLAEERDLADLADFREAQLYIVSGHVGEAVVRLRSVARRHPRTTGAALARIDALYLETITQERADESEPPSQEVIIAADSGDRPDYKPFTWLRASELLVELGRPELALHHFPRLEQLPQQWREDARVQRNRAMAAALAWPLLSDDPIATVAAHEVWESNLEGHPERDDLLRLVAQAQISLGLHEPAIDLLRAQLAQFPDPSEEALVSMDLARAYHGIVDLEHELEVLRFLVTRHPTQPGLADQVRAHALALHQDDVPLVEVQDTLETLRDAAADPELDRALFGIEADLVQALGTPAAIVSALERMQTVGFDDVDARTPVLARNLSLVGRHAEAAPMLRAVIMKTTDAEFRDALAYQLVQSELALEQVADAERILRETSTHGTRWGLVARTQLRERALARVVEGIG